MVSVELTCIDAFHGGASNQTFIIVSCLNCGLGSLWLFFAETDLFLTLFFHLFLDLCKLLTQIKEILKLYLIRVKFSSIFLFL